MTGEPISIIIPVYNVEKYLERCLQSVCRQTYENLEILLIDDGSADGSGRICDQAAARDKRIRVWHTENKGPSAARNLGIDQASSEYLLFADSDDILAEDHVAFLYEQLKAEQADLSICGFTVTYSGEFTVTEGEKRLRWTGKQALEHLLYQRYFTTGPVCKLYHKSLFDTVRFPVGTLYEDTLAIAQVVGQARRVVWSDAVKYGYFQRAGSTMRSDYNSRTFQYVEMAEQLLEYVQENHPELTAAAVSRFVWANIFVWVKLPARKSEQNAETARVRNLVQSNIKKYRRQVLKDPKARWKNKIVLLLSYLGQPLTRKIYLLQQ